MANKQNQPESGKSSAVTHEEVQQTAQSLERLFRSRPDIALHPCATKSDIAYQASAKRSLIHCRKHLNQLDASVWELLLHTGNIAFQELRTLLDDLPEEDLRASLSRLEDRWIVQTLDRGATWMPRGGNGLHFEYPIGLGRSFSELTKNTAAKKLQGIAVHLGLHNLPAKATRSDYSRAIAEHMQNIHVIRDMIASAPALVKQLLESAEHSGAPMVPTYHYSYNRDWQAALQWLELRGMLVSPQAYHSEIPYEVGIAMRNGRIFPNLSFRPPELQFDEFIDLTGNTFLAASSAIALVETACNAVLETRPQQLKNGGISVRDMKRIATICDFDISKATRAVEFASDAGFLRWIANDEYNSYGLLQTTQTYSEWREQSSGERWLHLIRSWIATSNDPSVSLRKTDDGKSVRPLNFDRYNDEDISCCRFGFLTALQTLREKRVDMRTDNFRSYVAWHAWRAFFRVGHIDYDSVSRVDDFVAEAELLGIVSDGVVHPAIFALFDDGITEANVYKDQLHVAAEIVDANAPAMVEEIAVQGDGAIIISGTPKPQLLRALEKFCEVRARDTAHLLQITESSVRNALDRNITSAYIIEMLTKHAPKGVPQSICYMIEDVARRHGHIVVHSSTSFAIASDASIAADMVRDKRIKKLGARLVSPTVLASDAKPEVLIDTLRAAGFMPVGDNAQNQGSESVIPGIPSFEAIRQVHVLFMDLHEAAQTAAERILHLNQQDEDLSSADREVVRLSALQHALRDLGISGTATSSIAESSEDIQSLIKVASELHTLIAFGNNENAIAVTMVLALRDDSVLGVDVEDLEPIRVPVAEISWAVLLTENEDVEESELIL